MKLVHTITCLGMLTAYGVLVTSSTDPWVLIASTIAVCTGLNMVMKNLIDEHYAKSQDLD
jgi:hypothetical protein